MWTKSLQNYTSYKRPGLFVIAAAKGQASLFAFPGSQLYPFSSAAKKRAFTKTLQMKRVTNLAFSVFVRHGHQQHADDEWKVKPVLDYNAYYIQSHVSLKDTISFAYRASFFV